MRVFCRKDPYSQIYATEKRKCNVTNLPWGSGATFSWYRWIQLKQIVKKWIIRTIYNSEVSLRKTQMHQTMLQFSISKVQVLVELSTDEFLLRINQNSRICMCYVCTFFWNYSHHTRIKRIRIFRSAKGRIIIRNRLSPWSLIWKRKVWWLRWLWTSYKTRH